jgi:hypothetical protein
VAVEAVSDVSDRRAAGVEYHARALRAATVGAPVFGAPTLDLRRVSKGVFRGDGAGHHAMAWSLAEGFDPRCETRDLDPIRRAYSAGVKGLLATRVPLAMGPPFAPSTAGR